MAYDEYLEERINNVLNERQIQFDARKMMGGLCYMIDDKMCFGIIKGDLMARVGIDAYEELIEQEGARPMDFTKRPMKGYIYVTPEGVDFQSDLEFWIQKALDFNPMAVASKSKKKKK
ncbi:MAG: TfoX/Sxy family transcriptional regulator of competence genes [Crocinitomicaceae bacterium]|jgi:TfoX/Sxy family transcriptional regulator of competence genes